MIYKYPYLTKAKSIWEDEEYMLYEFADRQEETSWL